jgi:formylglycine-generating enzyme required for sulfatase activity
MVAHSGLLVETDAGYAFGDHLTMQEFLAGCYLGAQYYRHESLIQKVAERSWWKEVLLFAVGYLAEDRDRSSDTPELLQILSGDKNLPPESQLVHLALAGEALTQLKARRQPPSWYLHLARRFANRLYDQLYTGPTKATIPVRQEAGLVLGRLYGLPGDETGVGDPRFTGPQGLPSFVQIPAGAFWMGSTKEEVEHWTEETGKDYFDSELPRHEVYLDVYDMAKYPTTNAMYAHFITAGGYEDERWWKEAIEDEYWNEDSGFRYGNAPRYWDDARWNNPSQPVVGVNWYEAVAYCRWLTATLNDGYVYRLPTEAEWERAARGPQGWAYPWGDAWQEGFCNSKEAGLEQTSPAGLFPQGATSEGVHEMVGNVWEWCRDWYAEDAYAESEPRNPTGPASGSSRVLRGGSWYNDGPPVCRCGFRDGLGPWGRDYYGGFRCVRILSSVP